MHQKSKYFAFLIIFLILLSSCRISQKKNSPEYVSYQFLSHFQQMEFDEAAKYGTENTKMLIMFFKNIIGMMQPEKRDSIQIPEANVEIKKCYVYENSAKCTYIANEKTDTLDLLKIEGKWLVDLKKESKKAEKL